MDDFRTLVKRQLPKLEGGAKSDLMRKYSCLVALDFEAAARLKAWASLEDLISVCTTSCIRRILLKRARKANLAETTTYTASWPTSFWRPRRPLLVSHLLCIVGK